MPEPSFRHGKASVGDVTLHYVEAGPADGEVVVLLHGWPQSWFAWRGVIPHLSARYRIVAPDLRGFGDSSRPLTGYDTRTVAGDIVGLLDHLGVARAHFAGHDFGAVTAYVAAAAYRDRVVSLAILDMLMPGFGLEDGVRFGKDGFGLWHLAFHAAPEVPEMLIAGREREYLGWFFRNHAANPSAIAPEDIEVYAANYRQPGASQAAMGYYRALYESAEQNRALAERKLTIPVLAIGGAMSIGPGVAAGMRGLAANVDERIIADAGHWVAEEQPAEGARLLLAFFAANPAKR